MSSQRFLILSDLHVQGPEDPKYAQLIAWLKAHRSNKVTFVLAGDIFDLLWGDHDYFRSLYYQFLNEIEATLQIGAQVHWIEGNHDLHLKPLFAEKNSVVVHDTFFTFEVGSRKVFVAHGDLVDREDWKYLMLRKALRGFPLRPFFSNLPGKWLSQIGSTMSVASRRFSDRNLRTVRLKEEKPQVQRIRDLYRNFAYEKFREGYDLIVMGHCHDRHDFIFCEGGRSGHYWNMGYPALDGHYLEWNSQLQDFERKALCF